MALKVRETVTKFLRDNPDKRYTAREIAEWVFETYPGECREKQKRSKARAIPLDSDNALIGQIVAEIYSNISVMQRLEPKVKTIEDSPRKFYFTESSDSDEISQAESDAQTPASGASGIVVKEHDLYPLLSEFLWSELEIYSRRIDEKRSHNHHGPGGNRWLYPDLVGMEDLSRDWHKEIKDCVEQYSGQKTVLSSFEVKMLVNRSNVREVFFQTVSNSSWANVGYLVASDIRGAGTLKELRVLSSSHGIGFIKLNIENPSESQIMIPAEYKDEIDWAAANRLAQQSEDFLSYIESVSGFHKVGRVHTSDWYPVPEKE